MEQQRSALWRTKDEREVLRKEMGRKRKMLKIAKSYLPTRTISIQEKAKNYEQICVQNIPEPNPVVILKQTRLDGIMELVRQQQRDREAADKLLSQFAKNC